MRDAYIRACPIFCVKGLTLSKRQQAAHSHDDTFYAGSSQEKAAFNAKQPRRAAVQGAEGPCAGPAAPCGHHSASRALQKPAPL